MVQSLEPKKELQGYVKVSSVVKKSTEQEKREVQLKVWQVLERIVEDLKFMDSSFNLTNYEAFVKETMANKERLKEKDVIQVSERCSTIIRKEMSIPKKWWSRELYDPMSCW